MCDNDVTLSLYELNIINVCLYLYINNYKYYNIYIYIYISVVFNLLFDCRKIIGGWGITLNLFIQYNIIYFHTLP